MTYSWDISPALLPFSGYAPAPKKYFLNCGAQNLALDSRWYFTNAKHRGTISSLVLLTTLFHAGQDVTGLLSQLTMLLPHVQLLSYSSPRSVSATQLYSHSSPAFSAAWGVVTKVEDPVLRLIEPHTIDLGPSIQSVQILLQSLPTI
ncbi:hypothetical protein WISP_01850 [Willisornis vidua]|uniref:Uncharacterized protein n=1 Tax=Willisornis vidua TaxID=1566151 RepID=A0ABQ9D1J2_9PASS|nr:hypothetical protein WISP_111431 [Willisornis vidua]KAJ7428094.1 hypothetical protein WISP_01910 [Willisornis vidua]KAJ7428125.1 hypothetical protein WISP_01850 [Willisornis vidua]